MNRLFRTLTVLTIAAALALPATAQDFGRVDNIESTSGTYFQHLLRGQPSIQVSAVGALRQPGLYELGSNADLRQLLALAEMCGGSTSGHRGGEIGLKYG